MLRHKILQAAGINPEDIGAVSKLKKLSDDRRDPIMYTLYKEIEYYLKPVIKQLSASLNVFAKVYTGHLTGVIPEIVFYLCFVRLHQKLIRRGMACCLPVVVNAAEKVCYVTDAYNINLFLHMLEKDRDPAKEMVPNRVYFGKSGRILLITGPNMGGKTVFTEMIGLIHVLFQAGVFVPGADAKISPVDNIYTHFPADESKTAELGRLGEESKRLGEIFNEATNLSIILLNESLASTSYAESLYLAKEVVRAIRYLGARAVYNTHMHALAENIDEFNNGASGDGMIQSLVTGNKDGRRSFTVQPGPPLGKSYAMDIAKKFGVSFEQLSEVINRKRTQD